MFLALDRSDNRSLELNGPATDKDQYVRVLQSALELSIEEGFDHVSVAEVVKRAQVGTQTFYDTVDPDRLRNPDTPMRDHVQIQLVRYCWSLVASRLSTVRKSMQTTLDLATRDPALAKVRSEFIFTLFSAMAGMAERSDERLVMRYLLMRGRREAETIDEHGHSRLLSQFEFANGFYTSTALLQEACLWNLQSRTSAPTDDAAVRAYLERLHLMFAATFMMHDVMAAEMDQIPEDQLSQFLEVLDEHLRNLEPPRGGSGRNAKPSTPSLVPAT